MVKKMLFVSLFVSFYANSLSNAANIEICSAIKPDSDSKATCPCSATPINPKSKGVIPVAIFTTESLVDEGCPDFNVAQIDPDTISLGPSQAKAVHFDAIDIDNDNDLDLIIHFQTQETGIQHGDTTVELTGSTIDGLEFHYQGLIKTVPKKGGKEVPPVFTPYINPDDPLLLTVSTSSGGYIEYFGEKDAEGFAIAANLVRVTDAGGNTTTISLDGQGRPARILGFNGTVFEITWQSNSLILVTAISADGSIQVNVSIDLTTLATTGLSVNTSLVNPIENIAPFRDVRSGERVRLTVGEQSNRVVSLQAASTSSSLIAVVNCGAPVNNAFVEMSVVPMSGNSFTLPAQIVGDGLYSVAIPTQPSNIGDQAQAICENIANALGHICTGLSLIPPGGETAICASIAAAIDLLLGGPTGEGAAIFAACQSGFAGARAYCNSIGWSPAPGAPSVADFISDNIDDIVDNVVVGDVFLQPLAIIPGVGFAGTPGAWAPATGPFPNFTIDSGSTLDIVSFTTNPVDPLPFQSYVATVEIRCAPPQTQVTMSII